MTQPPSSRALYGRRRGRPGRTSATVALLPAASILAMLAGAGPLSAQAAFREAPQWRFVAEMSAVTGGTWLEGRRAPTVSNGFGLLLGLGAERGLGETTTAGAILRFGQQNLRMRELGAEWDGGTLNEGQVLGTLSFHSRRRSALRLSADVGVGAAILSGAAETIPFSGASALSPMGEAGVAVRRGRADEGPSRRDVALLVRYSTVRLDMLSSATGGATGGWVGRFSIGLRATR